MVCATDNGTVTLNAKTSTGKVHLKVFGWKFFKERLPRRSTCRWSL